MYGDDRVRHCAECKLNVYNLSGMSRREAESLLLNSEGRLCIRYFRRSDGTVLTKDCPVGWDAFKRRSRRVASALASVVIGIISGVFGLRLAETTLNLLPLGDVPAVRLNNDLADRATAHEPMVGEAVVPIKSRREPMLGRVESIKKLSDEKVIAWVK
jgi:hypothetical protein